MIYKQLYNPFHYIPFHLLNTFTYQNDIQTIVTAGTSNQTKHENTEIKYKATAEI